MRASPILSAFNAGELGPLLAGRVDLDKYQRGWRFAEGFIPTVQGPAVRRAGTRYVAGVKDHAERVWLERFEFSATQAYILEFGDAYVRFYTLEGQVQISTPSAWVTATAYSQGALVVQAGTNYYCTFSHTSGVFATDFSSGYWHALTGTIYEIPSPYPLAGITNDDGTCALKIVQSGDVLYIANQKRLYRPMKLVRYGATDWRFIEYTPTSGPLLSQNITATTIYADATSGNVTLTASAALFANSDVYRLIRIQVQNLDVKPWEINTSYSTNDLVRYDGKTYKALNSATSGTSPPVHEQGNAYDGKSGVQWAYQDAGYGIARISAYTSPTQVDADVIVDAYNGLNQLPANVVGSGNATTRWSLGAWSATTEYPSGVAFYLNRLWWAGRQGLWGSVPNDFENMAGDFFNEIRADNAIWTSVQDEDVNEILWISPAAKLLIGTSGGIHGLAPLTTSDPLGPANVSITRESKRRARGVAPVDAGTDTLYVQRSGRKLLAMDFALERDAFVSQDMTVLSDRITRGGIVDLDFQAEPWSAAWCTTVTGRLIGFTYDRDESVTGWHRHPLGGNGFVESVAVIPSPSGDREQLWLAIRRTINGNTRRYIEFMEAQWEGPDEDGENGDDQEDAFYVDSGLTYDGAPVTTITGLGHLEAQTVQVLGDGAAQTDKVVTGGQITLDRAASVVHVGLYYRTRLVTVRPEAGGGDGTSQGKTKRADKVTVRFVDTLGGRCGLFNGRIDDISYRSPSTPMGQPQPFFSGDQDVDFPGDYDKDGCIEIQQNQPLPMTVAAIMPRMKTYP
jgi:hypothetical protein